MSRVKVGRLGEIAKNPTKDIRGDLVVWGNSLNFDMPLLFLTRAIDFSQLSKESCQSFENLAIINAL